MIKVFTDGSSRGNPGPGGWGAVLVFNDEKVTEIGGRSDQTTNNRMELTAVIEALKITDGGAIIVLYTDSSYVINGITKWIHSWKKNDWMSSEKKPVANPDLWKELLYLVEERQLVWKYVPGHLGVVGNERADEIATLFADKEKIKLFDGSLSEYTLDVSSVEINGEKKKERKKSSKKAYSYISLVDGKIYIDKTWQECERRTKGRSRVKYKKAHDLKHEQEILREFKSS
jgi:ribonuclease HI